MIITTARGRGVEVDEDAERDYPELFHVGAVLLAYGDRFEYSCEDHERIPTVCGDAEFVRHVNGEPTILQCRGHARRWVSDYQMLRRHQRLHQDERLLDVKDAMSPHPRRSPR